MIFHFKAAQNLVAELYERELDMMFHFLARQLGCKTYERYLDMNSTLRGSIPSFFFSSFGQNYYFIC